MRKARTQTVAGFGRTAVTDVVGQDDEITRRIEWLPGAEQDTGKVLCQELTARTTGPVQDQDSIADAAIFVPPRSTKSAVINFELGELLSTLELKTADNEISFFRLRIVCRQSV